MPRMTKLDFRYGMVFGAQTGLSLWCILYIQHHLAPPSAAFSAFLACFSLIISTSLCILCSLVSPLLASVSEALVPPPPFLAALARANSLWLPRAMFVVLQYLLKCYTQAVI